MAACATFRGEELEISFQSETYKTDYGVQGSPVLECLDEDTISVTSLSIFGINIDYYSLPQDAQKAILEALCAIEDDWSYE